MSDTTRHDLHDAVIVGAGPAGLAAALMLGRTHRDVVVLDSGTYRNDPTDAMHNVLGFDGAAPAEFRAAAHRRRPSSARTSASSHATGAYRIRSAGGPVPSCAVDVAGMAGGAGTAGAPAVLAAVPARWPLRDAAASSTSPRSPPAPSRTSRARPTSRTVRPA
ncbi:FAD-binding protein, partial [Isoptericola sp. QY 916]|uniref:FAD-binding protein n=1 Tax=Isoptericola sp. QY 916 TaxID=2782570 RepID=UPI003D2FC01D|nr:NAD(P)-binding protein [Isoptericola sp. QY 916]